MECDARLQGSMDLTCVGGELPSGCRNVVEIRTDFEGDRGGEAGLVVCRGSLVGGRCKALEEQEAST